MIVVDLIIGSLIILIRVLYGALDIFMDLITVDTRLSNGDNGYDVFSHTKVKGFVQGYKPAFAQEQKNLNIAH